MQSKYAYAFHSNLHSVRGIQLIIKVKNQKPLRISLEFHTGEIIQTHYRSELLSVRNNDLMNIDTDTSVNMAIMLYL